MVALLPKVDIQSLNIDTVEKALVFGALSLRAALVFESGDNLESLNVSFAVSPKSNTQSNLNINIYIPYDAYIFNAKGGQIIEAIQEYVISNYTYQDELDLTSTPFLGVLELPDYNEAVINTVEKYILFYTHLLIASIEDKRSNIARISFLEQQLNPQIFISLNLPFDIDGWSINGKYLDSLFPTVSAYAIPPLYGTVTPPAPSSNYEITINQPVFNTEYIFATITGAGTALGIIVESQGLTESSIYEFVFYQNDNSLSALALVADTEFGFGEIQLSDENTTTSVSVGDVFTIKYFGSDNLGDVTFTLVVEE